LQPALLGTLVTDKFTRVWGFHFLMTTLVHYMRVSTKS
jgi:hypothetical protein